MPEASTPAAAPAPVAGGTPVSAPAVTDAPPVLPSGLNVSTVDSATGAVTMPTVKAPVISVANDQPIDRGADAEFLVLHHRIGSGRHAHRRGSKLHRDDFGPDADLEWLVSQGAIVPIGRSEPETPADPLPPPAKTDPKKGLK